MPIDWRSIYSVYLIVVASPQLT